MSVTLDLLYRDEHVLVVNKPAGLLVHRGWAQDRVTAVDLARELVSARVHPLHRLDRGTSGALLFALDPISAARLSAAFESGTVEKRYLALVRGHLQTQGTLDHAIPGREHGPRIPAVTSYRSLGISMVDRCSLAEAFPHTGRLHQIRRHLKHLTHPVVGDVRYGDGKVNRHYRERFDLIRLALHAHTLAFGHPHRDETVRVFAPIPRELAQVLDALALPTSGLALQSRQPWLGRVSGAPTTVGLAPH